jgi:hypothetical protein
MLIVQATDLAHEYLTGPEMLAKDKSSSLLVIDDEANFL